MKSILYVCGYMFILLLIWLSFFIFHFLQVNIFKDWFCLPLLFTCITIIFLSIIFMYDVVEWIDPKINTYWNNRKYNKQIGKKQEKKKKKKLPEGNIIEGTNSLQCVCPFCEYGKGYNKPILGVALANDYKAVACPTCKKEFMALVA